MHFFLISKYKKSIGRDDFPNNDAQILPYLVSLGTRLFYIQSKILLYSDDPWILLFPMIYKFPFYLRVIMEKLAVYDEGVRLSLLSIDSVITTLQQNFDPNNDAPAKIREKLLLKKKNIFFAFSVRNRGRVSKTILQSGLNSTILQRFTKNQLCFSGMKNSMRRYPKLIFKKMTIITTASNSFSLITTDPPKLGFHST